MKQLYEFGIEERSGEQEYNYKQYVWASSGEEAKQLAHEYAETFYEDGELVDEDHWSIGEIDWTLDYLKQVDRISVLTINSPELVFRVRDVVDISSEACPQCGEVNPYIDGGDVDYRICNACNHSWRSTTL